MRHSWSNKFELKVGSQAKDYSKIFNIYAKRFIKTENRNPMMQEVGVTSYRARAINSRSRLVTVPLTFQAKKQILFLFYVII